MQTPRAALITLSVLFVSMSGAGCGSGSKLDAIALTRDARAAMTRNDAAAALPLAESAIQALRAKHAPGRAIALGEALAADAAFGVGNAPGALLHYKKAISIAENLLIARKIADADEISGELVRIGQKRHLSGAEMVPALVLYGNALAAQGKAIDAQRAWEEALAGGPAQADSSRRKFAAAIFALSSKYEDLDKRSHADTLYAKTVDWCKSDSQLIKAIVAEADFNMTLEKFSCRNLLLAILPVVESDPQTPDDIKNELLRKTGVIASDSEDFKLSKEIHLRLLAAYDRSPGTSQKDKQQVLEHLARAEFKTKEWLPAKSHFRRLASICRSNQPPDERMAASYDLTIENIDAQTGNKAAH